MHVSLCFNSVSAAKRQRRQATSEPLSVLSVDTLKREPDTAEAESSVQPNLHEFLATVHATPLVPVSNSLDSSAPAGRHGVSLATDDDTGISDDLPVVARRTSSGPRRLDFTVDHLPSVSPGAAAGSATGLVRNSYSPCPLIASLSAAPLHCGSM